MNAMEKAKELDWRCMCDVIGLKDAGMYKGWQLYASCIWCSLSDNHAVMHPGRMTSFLLLDSVAN